jgi:hypothetical protein
MNKDNTGRFQRNIEDLLKNEEFMRRVVEVRQYLDIATAPGSGEKVLEADRKVEELSLKLAEDYHLAYHDDSPLYQLIQDGKMTKYPDEAAGPCLIMPDWSRFNSVLVDPGTGKKERLTVDDPETDLEKRTRHAAYPASVSISADASLEEVVQYVRSHWSEIEDIQREAKPIAKQSRQRRTELRDQFIWENKDEMPRQQLAKIVRQKFGEATSFSEQHLNAIIRKLRGRYGEI